ncbi:MAG: hypothetical protein FJ030_07340 [Chloroflexi bacterium]|nr:hypothetical protein [Chloroflexota bacterium]
MKRLSRGLAIIGVPLGAGLGLLALALAQNETETPRTLPPPQLSTQLPPPPFAVTPPLAEAPVITIASQPYRHPSGAFTVPYPDGWQIDESEDSAQFTTPDDIGQFSVAFALAESAPNGDYESDVRTTWGDLPSFALVEIDSSLLPDQWSATFTFDQSLPPDNITVRVVGLAEYLPRERVLYIFTALAQSPARELLMPIFQSIAASLQTDPNAALSDSE